ncbi:1-aminocyclopropane-1-carboxylate deaminase/D-cysteine desulfhydrase [Chitinophaga parva]|nr:pyridoxal-phosphate dependent enzyme [Chitinophaga parva]
MILPEIPILPISKVQPDWLPAGLCADMLRLDQLHAAISGNKWYKLKRNLEAALAGGKTGLLTFGGAWSNHLAATAAACHATGLRSIGVVRGERPATLSLTLQQAQAHGMELQFISREAYRTVNPAEWGARFPEYFVVPEGGHNALGALGCEDILKSAPGLDAYTHLLCAGGTGTTLAGLINSAAPGQTVIGIPVLKQAEWMEASIRELLRPRHTPVAWQLHYQFHQGGYAKTSPALFAFMNDFHAQTGIPLDIIYTGKMGMAFRGLALGGHFQAGSRILLLHTGGLQGNLSLPPGVLSFH